MTIYNWLKSILKRIWARFTALRFIRKLQTVFPRAMQESPRQLRVTEEFRTAPFPATGTPDREHLPEADAKSILPPDPSSGPTGDIHEQTEADFHGLINLEAFVKGTTVTRETIKKWVAAGILSPQETLVAEKLIKLMSKNPNGSADGDNGSPLT
jgi:hypothetical protein